MLFPNLGEDSVWSNRLYVEAPVTLTQQFYYCLSAHHVQSNADYLKIKLNIIMRRHFDFKKLHIFKYPSLCAHLAGKGT